MLQKIPKELLSSEYRIEMWKNSQKIIKKLEKVLPISSAYLLGSFTTEKKRPADVDFIILLQMKDKSKFNWSVDFVVAPLENMVNLYWKMLRSG
jgi:predicted nucleotidyltransferase